MLKKSRRKKLTVAILAGGKSAEHEISLLSAQNILQVIDKNKYHPLLIKIDKKGKISNSKLIKIGKTGRITLPFPSIDVVFPVLHGPFGEDGTVQGLLKLVNVPFVGSGVLSSAIGLDKEASKRLLKEAKIPVANFSVFKDPKEIAFGKVTRKLGLPLFVKPANLGSSIGVSKVKSQKDFKKAVNLAFQYDRKILIEEYISGREIECALLGNDRPFASLPGEVIVNDEFYSYQAKYLEESSALLQIPAKLDSKTRKKIQLLAVSAFKALFCEGMARVDFFLKDNGEILVSEINTIPGFTSVSMYPKLWEASGISYPKLIDKLIQLALSRFKKEQKIKTRL